MPDFTQPDAIKKHAAALEALGSKCVSTEAIAVDSVNYLYNQFGDIAGSQNCALMRFFRTMPYFELLPYLQDKVQRSLGYIPQESAACLTLLASRGIEPAWNDRLASEHHQVIPLLSTTIIEQAPMVAQLIHRLGIQASDVVEPNPTLFLSPSKKQYDVMYVPEAREQKHVFAQANFVEPFGIRSVIGFGTLLPTGDMIALLMFMREHVPKAAAMQCYELARSLEIAINQLRSGKKKGARILVAADSAGAKRLKDLLGSRHTVVSSSTVEQALTELKKSSYDLIICGTLFDDSRMFDLLRELKKQRRERTKPFVCFKEMQFGLGDSVERGVKTTAEILGAACYIDGHTMTDDELEGALQAYLPEQIWE